MFSRYLMYEGDGLIHAAPGGADDSPAGATVPAAESERPQAGPDVANRRAQAMRAFFPKLALWLNNRIHFARMREIESYLAQATDLADLERRIAKIKRNALWH
jgi:hypothetical protein